MLKDIEMLLKVLDLENNYYNKSRHSFLSVFIYRKEVIWKRKYLNLILGVEN